MECLINGDKNHGLQPPTSAEKNIPTNRDHPSSFFLPCFSQVMLGMRALAVCLLVATCSEIDKQLATDMCQVRRRDCGYTVYLGELPVTVITRIRKKSLQKFTCYCYWEGVGCLPVYTCRLLIVCQVHEISQ